MSPNPNLQQTGWMLDFDIIAGHPTRFGLRAKNLHTIARKSYYCA